MTREQVAIMLGTMREIYGKQSDSPNPAMLIDLWYRYLADEPVGLVQQAFDEHVATNKFAPKPAEILELVEKAKWRLYEPTLYMDVFGDKPKEIPPEYLPRMVSRKQKQYQIANQARLDKNIKQLADKLRLE
jgi:hypothetical protein